MSDLTINRKSGWEDVAEEEKVQIYDFANNYMDFLNNAKTEREIIKETEKLARARGFKSLNEYPELYPGDKVYYINREKNIYLAVIGEETMESGLNIIGAHADSPRLDLKPNPLKQEGNLAYLKTHYYGGIKKYQWTAIPLAIHGIIVKENGEKIYVSIGENDNEPVFTITDLLPHLAKEQQQKKLSEAINGENLSVLVGSIPDKDEEKEKVKSYILKLLNKKYGITEEDFVSSELEIVPAFKCRTLGFGEILIAGYGQDDKFCVYTT